MDAVKFSAHSISSLHPTFFEEIYQSQESADEHFLVRQVPGDGSCLFNALTVCLDYAHTQLHNDFDEKRRKVSERIRKLSVDLLRKNVTLFMENSETIQSTQLLSLISEHYNLTSEEYCLQMLDPATWGGGPEILAVCNHIRRPIHVYELTGTESRRSSKSSASKVRLGRHKFKVCAKFGSPEFDTKRPLHILCADGRFPNIAPKQAKKAGDHFLAMFPCDDHGQILSSSGTRIKEDASLKADKSERAWWSRINAQAANDKSAPLSFLPRWQRHAARAVSPPQLPRAAPKLENHAAGK